MAVTTRSRARKSSTSPKNSKSPKNKKTVTKDSRVVKGSSTKEWFDTLSSPTKVKGSPLPKNFRNKEAEKVKKAVKIRAAPLRIESKDESESASSDASSLRDASEGSEMEDDLSYTEEEGSSEEYEEEERENEYVDSEGDEDSEYSLHYLGDAALSERRSKYTPSEEGQVKRKKKIPPRGKQRRPRGISEESIEAIEKHMRKTQEEQVIYTQAEFGVNQRRKRVNWTPQEMMYLRMGVEKFGIASWVEILQCPDYHFHPHRTPVDLKDKWRNATAYREYSQLRKRPFTLLNADHSLVINPRTGKPYLFHNKWPRDVAAKAASRDEFYEKDSDTCIIFVKELNEIGEGVRPVNAERLEPVVHVYQGNRKRVPAPTHLRQFEVKLVWNADVVKIREERLISKECLENLHFRRFK